MDKQKLDKKLDEWIKKLPQEDRKCLLAHLSSLKSIYPFNEYEYRLMYLLDKKIINVEVKASRAINTKIRGGLEHKALSIKSDEPYWMNFQQLKLGIVDVFVFIGVWVDKIYYWVLTNKEVKNHPMRSHQHRGGI